MPVMNRIPKKNGKKDKRQLYVRMKRRARLLYLKILRIDDPPERIARGAAIGVFMGIFPTFGLGALLSLGAAFVLRANKAAAIIGSFIMNPLTSPFFWTLSAVVGSVILNEDRHTILARAKNGGFWDNVGWGYLVFLAGNTVVSVLFAAAAYFLTKWAVIRHRRKKAHKRAALTKE